MQEVGKSSKSFANADIMSSLPPARSSRAFRCLICILPLSSSFSPSAHASLPSLALPSHLRPIQPHSPYPPDDVEDGWYEELIVDGHGHVARLVESRGNGAYGVAEVHAPQQEQELRWGNKRKSNVKVTVFIVFSFLSEIRFRWVFVCASSRDNTQSRKLFFFLFCFFSKMPPVRLETFKRTKLQNQSTALNLQCGTFTYKSRSKFKLTARKISVFHSKPEFLDLRVCGYVPMLMQCVLCQPIKFLLLVCLCD